jgi:hypothetical protein
MTVPMTDLAVDGTRLVIGCGITVRAHNRP